MNLEMASRTRNEGAWRITPVALVRLQKCSGGGDSLDQAARYVHQVTGAVTKPEPTNKGSQANYALE